jgi:hypothetical protein
MKKVTNRNGRKRTVFNYINGHLGSENLLDQNSLLLLRHIPSKATDKNVNTERVRKYFTKYGWKALKALIKCTIFFVIKYDVICEYCATRHD